MRPLHRPKSCCGSQDTAVTGFSATLEPSKPIPIPFSKKVWLTKDTSLSPLHSPIPPPQHRLPPQESKRETSGKRAREEVSEIHGFHRRVEGSPAGHPPQAAPRRGAVRLREARRRGRLRRHPLPPPVQHRAPPLRRRRRRRVRRQRGVQRPRRRPPPRRPRHQRPLLLLHLRCARPVRRADEPGTAAGPDGGHRGATARVVGGEGGRRRGALQDPAARAGEGAREGVGGAERPGDQGRGGEGPGGRRRRRAAALQQPHRAPHRRVQDGQDQGGDEERHAQGGRAQAQGGGAQGRLPGQGRVEQ